MKTCKGISYERIFIKVTFVNSRNFYTSSYVQMEIVSRNIVACSSRSPRSEIALRFSNSVRNNFNECRSHHNCKIARNNFNPSQPSRTLLATILSGQCKNQASIPTISVELSSNRISLQCKL